MKTVAIFPRMVFPVSAAAVTTSFFLRSLIRIPKDDEYHRQSLGDLEEPGSSDASAQERT